MPDAPKAIVFAPELKFEVSATPIVALGSVSGFAVSLVGPVSTYEVPAVTFFSRRRPPPSRPYTLYDVAPVYADQLTVILLVSPEAIVSDATVPGTSAPLASTAVTS